MSIIAKAVEQLLQQRPAVPGGQPLPELQEAAPPDVRQHAKPQAAAQEAKAFEPHDVKASRRRIHLDLDRLRSNGLVIPGETSPIAEEYRIIKRPLLLNAFGPDQVERGNLLMVTSARPGEGKTFTAVNLALSMLSEQDVTVLLIDGDAINPTVPRVLGFDFDLGLTDVLADERLDLADVLIRTNIEKLSILPAGRRHPLANELLASARMSAFVDEVAARYKDRIIIFDSPPVLATTDPTVLALHVGQVAFVVEAEGTGKAAIEESMRILGSCRHLGLILNKARRGNQLYGYNGYYYASSR
jgi:exopolysaccharide/PEP-CTERM locus tyrosine autokinase